LAARAEAQELDLVIGRHDVVRRTIQVLSRRIKNNPLLIAEAGVGKTAIVERLAQAIVTNDVPESMRNKRVISLDLPALLAGASYQGQFEERLKSVLRDIEEEAGRIILFIDEIHMLVNAGAAKGGMDASNMLKPALARGQLHCVGATTLDEYRTYIEADAALARRFKTILVPEPTVEDTVSILRGLKERYEVHHGVRIADGALVAAATLSNRYITDRFLPDKAIDLVDEAASRLRLEQESKPEALENIDRRILRMRIELEALRKEKDPASVKRREEIERQVAEAKEESQALTSKWFEEQRKFNERKEASAKLEQARKDLELAERMGDFSKAGQLVHSTIPDLEAAVAATPGDGGEEGDPLVSDTVTEEAISEVVSRSTGIPLSKLGTGDRERLLRMEEVLEQSVVGQQEAVDAVSNAVRVSRAGLHPGSKPLGSFLFLGPTGVGKTALAKAIAEFLFDSEREIVRIDCSEYSEQHSVARLVGAPPGYVGYDRGGQLTEAVRRKPYSLVLFDEMEKAHPNVWASLLQLLDDGRLTDSQGRLVDFSNTIVILTSNLGAEALASAQASGSVTDLEAAQEQVLQVVKSRVPPEFLNRLDGIVQFNALRPEHMDRIVDIQVGELIGRAAKLELELTVTPEARSYLARHGYDAAYGARPLRRLIAQSIEQPLAKLVLQGTLQKEKPVVVSVEGDKIVVA
jgi:ATP-dependent Clp protease ATP-binding subunit ClpB